MIEELKPETVEELIKYVCADVMNIEVEDGRIKIIISLYKTRIVNTRAFLFALADVEFEPSEGPAKGRPEDFSGFIISKPFAKLFAQQLFIKKGIPLNFPADQREKLLKIME